MIKYNGKRAFGVKRGKFRTAARARLSRRSVCQRKYRKGFGSAKGSIGKASALTKEVSEKLRLCQISEGLTYRLPSKLSVERNIK